jgi:hypothetical protein
MTDATSVPVIDYSQLRLRATADEVAAWRSRARATNQSWASRPRSATIAAAGIGFTGIFVSAVVGLIVTAIAFSPPAGAGSSWTPGTGSVITLLIGLLLSLTIVGVSLGLMIRSWRASGPDWPGWARMDRFATANGLTFSPHQADPPYPGLIFTMGDTRSSLDHYMRTTGDFLDLGNFCFWTGRGQSRSMSAWGFIAMRLDRRLPNMLLESTRPGHGLDVKYDRGQILHLEGDFDRSFTLYCPSGYQQDALYVFTPDVMALLLDDASGLDIEIVDDWMFVYSRIPFDMGDPAELRRLFGIADTVGVKTRRQTTRYSDDRSPEVHSDVVAQQGVRLTTHWPIGVGVLLVAVGLYVTASLVIAAVNVAIGHHG